MQGKATKLISEDDKDVNQDESNTDGVDFIPTDSPLQSSVPAKKTTVKRVKKAAVPAKKPVNSQDSGDSTEKRVAKKATVKKTTVKKTPVKKIAESTTLDSNFSDIGQTQDEATQNEIANASLSIFPNVSDDNSAQKLIKITTAETPETEISNLAESQNNSRSKESSNNKKSPIQNNFEKPISENVSSTRIKLDNRELEKTDDLNDPKVTQSNKIKAKRSLFSRLFKQSGKISEFKVAIWIVILSLTGGYFGYQYSQKQLDEGAFVYSDKAQKFHSLGKEFPLDLLSGSRTEQLNQILVALSMGYYTNVIDKLNPRVNDYYDSGLEIRYLPDILAIENGGKSFLKTNSGENVISGHLGNLTLSIKNGYLLFTPKEFQNEIGIQDVYSDNNRAAQILNPKYVKSDDPSVNAHLKYYPVAAIKLPWNDGKLTGDITSINATTNSTSSQTNNLIIERSQWCLTYSDSKSSKPISFTNYGRVKNCTNSKFTVENYTTPPLYEINNPDRIKSLPTDLQTFVTKLSAFQKRNNACKAFLGEGGDAISSVYSAAYGAFIDQFKKYAPQSEAETQTLEKFTSAQNRVLQELATKANNIYAALNNINSIYTPQCQGVIENMQEAVTMATPSLASILSLIKSDQALFKSVWLGYNEIIDLCKGICQFQGCGVASNAPSYNLLTDRYPSGSDFAFSPNLITFTNGHWNWIPKGYYGNGDLVDDSSSSAGGY